MITADGSPVDEETETRVKWIATSGFGGESQSVPMAQADSIL
jgi:hypothetical protein